MGGEMYGRPMEVRKYTICKENLYWKNQKANLPFLWHVVRDSTHMAPLLHLQPNLAHHPLWEFDRGPYVSPMGNCFLAVVFSAIQFILQKMFAGRTAKMWLAIRNP